MTNGEKMQEIFPEGKTRKCRDGVVFESDGWCHAYDSDWWNAEYKEPRKGHWIKTGDYYTGAYGSIEYVKCSCCHEDSLEEGDFCPNCGAKMAESEVE